VCRVRHLQLARRPTLTRTPVDTSVAPGSTGAPSCATNTRVVAVVSVLCAKATKAERRGGPEGTRARHPASRGAELRHTGLRAARRGARAPARQPRGRARRGFRSRHTPRSRAQRSGVPRCRERGGTCPWRFICEEPRPRSQDCAQGPMSRGGPRLTRRAINSRSRVAVCVRVCDTSHRVARSAVIVRAHAQALVETREELDARARAPRRCSARAAAACRSPPFACRSERAQRDGLRERRGPARRRA